MHLSYGDKSSRRKCWDFACKHNLVGLADPEDRVNEDWFEFKRKHGEDENKKLIGDARFQQLKLFCEDMKVEDIVVIMAGEDRLLGIGLVGDYWYEPRYHSKRGGEFFSHVREVKCWIRRMEYDEAISFHIPEGYAFKRTIRKIERDKDSELWNKLTRQDIGEVKKGSS